MPRSRYRLQTEGDAKIVRDYVARAMKRDGSGISSSLGYGAFVAAQTPAALQAWCDEHLAPGVWKKIMVIVRQSRMRKQRVRIEVPQRIHTALKRIATEMKKKTGKSPTFAEVIERMEDCYWAVEDAACKPTRRTTR